jgi:hypothetical protein
MRLRMICAAAAITLVGTFYLLAGLSGRSLAILTAGSLLSLLPYYGLWRFLAAEADTDVDLYLPGVVTVIGIILGATVRWLCGLSQPILVDLLALVLAAASSGIIIAIRLQGRGWRCERCRHPLTQTSDRCARCDRMVCSRVGCWVADYRRCSDCEKHQVRLFPLREEWWMKRLGPRADNGRCLKCEREAGECDLRRCGRCPWPMCTECWDMENGRCLRCGWTMPDLPESLRQVSLK